MSSKATAINLCKGACIELINEGLSDIALDCVDPNKQYDAKRVLTLKIEIKPTHPDQPAKVDVNSALKLAPNRPVITSVHLGADEDGIPGLFEPGLNQTPLFGKQSDENVQSINDASNQ